MSLSVYLNVIKPCEIYHGSLTHNLAQMAEEAGLYNYLWRADEHGFTHAYQLIDGLEEGIKKLRKLPEYYKQFEPENGWGKYSGLLEFTENYLKACKENPEALIEICR